MCIRDRSGGGDDDYDKMKSLPETRKCWSAASNDSVRTRVKSTQMDETGRSCRTVERGNCREGKLYRRHVPNDCRVSRVADASMKNKLCPHAIGGGEDTIPIGIPAHCEVSSRGQSTRLFPDGGVVDF